MHFKLHASYSTLVTALGIMEVWSFQPKASLTFLFNGSAVYIG